MRKDQVEDTLLLDDRDRQVGSLQEGVLQLEEEVQNIQMMSWFFEFVGKGASVEDQAEIQYILNLETAATRPRGRPQGLLQSEFRLLLLWHLPHSPLLSSKCNNPHLSRQHLQDSQVWLLPHP